MLNKKKLNLKYLFLFCCLNVQFLFFYICDAVASNPLLQYNKIEIQDQAVMLKDTAGFNEANVGDVLALFIKGFLSVLGIIFIILIIVAGYNWMTAGGEEEKVTKAKDMIKRAVIGLIIIVAAYAISYFVFQALSGTVTGGPGLK